MQVVFNKRVKTLTTKNIAETASTTKRIETHTTMTILPVIQRTENTTVEIQQSTKEIEERGHQTYVELREVSNTVAIHAEVLLSIQELLSDLLANNECKSRLCKGRKIT